MSAFYVVGLVITAIAAASIAVVVLGVLRSAAPADRQHEDRAQLAYLDEWRRRHEIRRRRRHEAHV
jgi:hypothetical protein